VFRELSVAEQRYQAVLAVIEDGLQITEAAAKAGVTRQAVHTWLSRYAQGGLEALADRSHRLRSCPHQMDPVVEVRLVELRGLHPGWGPDRLRYRLQREGVGPLPSRAAIGRALARLGLVRPGRRRGARREYRRWERGRPMELWQLDVMGGVLLGTASSSRRSLRSMTTRGSAWPWAWSSGPPRGRFAGCSPGRWRSSARRRRC
jgi:transposase